MLENEIQEMMEKIIRSLGKDNKNRPSNTFYINLDNMKKGSKFDLIDLLKNTPETKLNKNNEMNRITTKPIEKNKIKADIDNRKDLNKGDIVKIIDGEYKGLSNKECKFLDYVKMMDKVLIQTDKFNRLYVNPEDVELIRKVREEYEKEIYNEVEGKYEKITFIKNKKFIKAILTDGSTALAHNEEHNKLKVEKLAYYKAKTRQYDNLIIKLKNN
ncbi:hypothetical protein [Clostridium botulinum]|uniref:hypothetical protein n=1 Tax=Clostridium botulinum TaxID=1491 RepID=UPI001C9AAE8B|nr:hypothetical protein [Clostridium botulinum]MBY6842625.1 hypothetical protein [Clostridium botulinum]